MAWMTSAVPRTRARAPAHQMKIGRRSASHDDHPNLCVAGSTACDTRSATAEPVPQRRRDELLDQLGPVPGSGRLEVAARSKRPGSQRKLERPEAGAFHVELDAEIGAAKMDVKRWDPVRPDVRDADLPPLEEKAAEPLGQELGTTGEQEPVPRDLVRRLARAPELDAVTEVVIALALADEDERAEHEGIGLPVEHTILETETASWPRAQLFRAVHDVVPRKRLQRVDCNELCVRRHVEERGLDTEGEPHQHDENNGGLHERAHEGGRPHCAEI